jgi:eukaryotic-like serine/threonine-protein kinase
LDWIVMKAVEKDRSQRYETVNGLLRDLQRYLAGEPVEAGPPSTAYRVRKIVRRYRLWLSVAAAFAVLLAAGVVVSTWMAVRARRAEQSAILERDTAKAVSDFLQKDLLAQGSNEEQAAPGTSPDPDLKVRTAIDRAAARIDGKFASQPLVEASVRHTVGVSYHDLGLYQEAQKQFERALDIRRRVLGPNHADTIQTMAKLGTIYKSEGRYAQAEQILESVLDVQRRSLGKENPQTLDTMSALGATLVDQGKYTLAEPLLNEALQGQRHVLGEEDLNTLSTMERIGSLSDLQGKYQQSEQILAKALDIARRVLGEEHPGSVSMMNSLANVYSRDGKAEQAEELYIQVQGIQSRVRGPEHPNTLTTKLNLAMLYLKQGQYTQAKPLVTAVWSVAPRVWGAEHPRTLVAMGNLADVYAGQGEYAQAESLYAKLADVRRRVLGPDNAATANALASLGSTRIKLHKYEAAEPVLRESLNVRERTSPDSWLRFKSESLLGESLAGQGKYAEGEPLLLSGYAGLLQRNDAIPKSASTSSVDAATCLADLYRHWGKLDKAAEWQAKVKAGR